LVGWEQGAGWPLIPDAATTVGAEPPVKEPGTCMGANKLYKMLTKAFALGAGSQEVNKLAPI